MPTNQAARTAPHIQAALDAIDRAFDPKRALKNARHTILQQAYLFEKVARLRSSLLKGYGFDDGACQREAIRARLRAGARGIDRKVLVAMLIGERARAGLRRPLAAAIFAQRYALKAFNIGEI